MAILASRLRYHLSVMSPRDKTICLHGRLHIGAPKLRRLPELTSDAPPSLASGRLDSCAACSAKPTQPGCRTKPNYTGHRTPAG
eukprot:1214780-Pleurochrysis_carterae.AAC.1